MIALVQTRPGLNLISLPFALVLLNRVIEGDTLVCPPILYVVGECDEQIRFSRHNQKSI